MGRRRKTSIRVRGPYRSRGGWRYEIVHPNGTREGHACRAGCSEAEAQDEVAGAREVLERPTQDLTVSYAIEAYAEHLRKGGATAATAAWVGLSTRRLVEELRETGRVEWVQEEFDWLSDPHRYEPHAPEEAFRKVRGWAATQATLSL